MTDDLEHRTQSPPAKRESDRTAQTSSLFPDIPHELIPKSLDGSILSPGELKQAHSAIDLIAEKMSSIITEYANGRVNQAQFQVVYTRYCEQKIFIERILSGEINGATWESGSAAGSTSLLRRLYAAHVIGQLLVEIQSGETIRMFGAFDLKSDLLVPILNTLIERSVNAFEAGTKSTVLEGGHWLTFVPGEFSASMTIFSQEASGQQLLSLVQL